MRAGGCPKLQMETSQGPALISSHFVSFESFTISLLFHSCSDEATTERLRPCMSSSRTGMKKIPSNVTLNMPGKTAVRNLSSVVAKEQVVKTMQ